MENGKSGKLIISSLILGLSLIIGTIIVSTAIYNIKKLSDTLSVTGSAKEKIVSDSVKWRSNFTRIVTTEEIKSGYAQMKKDEQAVLKFLNDNGISKDQATISAVMMNEIYKANDSSPKEYNLQQTVEVDSSDVQKLTALTKNIQPLIDQGVIFSTQSVEYYTSKLPELRVSLLSEAIKDAKARAGKIAESSGKKVGAIQSASMGIVQVLPVNSVVISDWGTYDTSSIDKDVMVTVKTIFRLE
jgi:hypothetical protein